VSDDASKQSSLVEAAMHTLGTPRGGTSTRPPDGAAAGPSPSREEQYAAQYERAFGTLLALFEVPAWKKLLHGHWATRSWAARAAAPTTAPILWSSLALCM